MKKRWRAMILLLIAHFFSWIGPQRLLAQEYRTALKIPPAKIYAAMLEFAAKKDYKKISKSLVMIRPVLVEIKDKFDVDLVQKIDSALIKGEQLPILTIVLETIFWDMKDIFSVILEDKDRAPTQLSALLKMALLNYVVLSPVVAKIQESTDREIKELFKQGVTLLEGEGYVNFKKLTEILTDIEKSCLKVFPEFKPPKKSG